MTPKEYKADYYQKNKAKWKTPEALVAARLRSREWYAANPERARAGVKKYRDTNGDRISARLREKLYGTDGADLFYKQNGLCGICAVDLLWLPAIHRHLDHCHTSNNVRGWLCNSCNRGVGWFKDDPALLKSAAKYLRR